MRVMVLVKANEDSESGRVPSTDELAEMGAFNEELLKAGVMLAADGLRDSSMGKRVRFDDEGSSAVIDGPFAETKELVAGYWVWQVSSMDEAVEWLRRAPFRGSEVEIRQVFEADDFGDSLTPELREQEDRMREPARRMTRDARRDRRGLADRGRPADRRAGPPHRRSRPRGGPRPGRPRRGPRAVAARGRPGQPRRLADDGRQTQVRRRRAP